MPEQRLSLYELNQQIKTVVDHGFEHAVWVTAEIHQMNVHRRGHCYMELVEKDPGSEHIHARSRAIIWAMQFRMIKAYFESESGHELKAGLRVLVKAEVQFHEQYGLSLHIRDIDPAYTLGEMEQQRRAIIRKLEEAGVIEMNKSLLLPHVISKIAVISSEQAAGFGDFLNHLQSNAYGYAFSVQLFQAVMQGNGTESSVTYALEQIFDSGTDFDLVCIMRGGGSRTDLAAFDNFQIAMHVAQFPIPVIAGIGHDRDSSVTDMVAHTHLKTPTAVSDFILNHNRRFEEKLDNLNLELWEQARSFMDNRRHQIQSYTYQLIPNARSSMEGQKNRLLRNEHSIGIRSREVLMEEKHILQDFQKQTARLSQQNLRDSLAMLDSQAALIKQILPQKLNAQEDRLEQNLKLLKANNPVRLLKKGYSITTQDGKLLKSVQHIQPGKIITTRLSDGRIESEITE